MRVRRRQMFKMTIICFIAYNSCEQSWTLCDKILSHFWEIAVFDGDTYLANILCIYGGP